MIDKTRERKGINIINFSHGRQIRAFPHLESSISYPSHPSSPVLGPHNIHFLLLVSRISKHRWVLPYGASNSKSSVYPSGSRFISETFVFQAYLEFSCITCKHWFDQKRVEYPHYPSRFLFSLFFSQMFCALEEGQAQITNHCRQTTDPSFQQSPFSSNDPILYLYCIILRSKNLNAQINREPRIPRSESQS